MKPAVSVKVKPKFRGVSHLLAFVAALGGLVLLGVSRASGTQHLAGVLYGISLATTLGISALYHRPMWSLPARKRMRTLDHAGIGILIAGTYTPLAVLDSQGRWTVGLWAMWGGALLALAFALFWSQAPRGLRAALYVGLGLLSAPLLLKLGGLIGSDRLALLLVGAGIYIAGAVVYALRWPNPKPSVFGYHEVFHLMVIAAAAVHFIVVLGVQNRV